MPLARISLTLSRHFSLSFIASGRSSGLHPISSYSCCIYVRAGRPAFARPYAGVHRSTSLLSSSLLYIYICMYVCMNACVCVRERERDASWSYIRVNLRAKYKTLDPVSCLPILKSGVWSYCKKRMWRSFCVLIESQRFTCAESSSHGMLWGCLKKDMIFKNIKLQPVYIWSKRNKMTVFNVPIDLTGDVLESYFSSFRNAKAANSFYT